MQNSAWEKYKNVENEKSLWCTKQAGQWSNGGRIVKWWLWQKLWTKIFFRSHFLKIYGPQVPILCPSCRQQWVFFSRLATELEFPLLKGFVLPPHFQVRRGTCLRPSQLFKSSKTTKFESSRCAPVHRKEKSSPNISYPENCSAAILVVRIEQSLKTLMDGFTQFSLL